MTLRPPPTAAFVLACCAAALSSCDERKPRALETVPATPAQTWGLDKRPVAATCGGATGTTGTSESAKISFESLTTGQLIKPLEIIARAGRILVAEQTGVIRDLLPDQTTVMSVLDIRARVTVGYDQGIQGFTLHPSFPAKPYIYVSYTAPHPQNPAPASVVFQSVIARFESTNGGLTFDPSTEKRLLVWDQPGANHNNGCVAFGPDGYLYIGSGDGADPADLKFEHALKTDRLLGKILRIDVDGGDPYAIPAGNPYAAGGGRPEIYALGLRNPWRFAFDAKTNRLWAGDVGFLDWEEIDEIVVGGNYGWGSREGRVCHPLGPGCDGNFIEPLVVHPHTEAAAIIGGVFYHGTAIPELTGKYIYADASSSYWWAIPTDASPKIPVRIDVGLAKTRPVSIKLDESGEMIFVSYFGKAYRIMPPSLIEPRQFAVSLTESGCVDPSNPSTPASGMFHYDVNVSQWVDGATADRYLTVPADANITVEPDGRLTLPPRSVVMKTLRAEDRNVETQLLVREADGDWRAETYAWNTGQSNARLVTSTTKVSLPSGNVHTIDPQSCVQCHTAERGTTIGLEVGQIDRAGVDYGERQGNPLATLVHVGMIAAPVDPTSYRTLPMLDGIGSVESRARAYLHANCAFCHRGEGSLDLRFTTPLRDTRTCSVNAAAGGLLFAPGKPEESYLLTTMKLPAPGRMPPVGSYVVDDRGASLVADWIRFTATCP